MIGETVSHYRVLERIGGGGMGVVYKAEDLNLGRVVALKFLNPSFTSNETNRKRFLREAQAASLIDHPNVCHVYQVEEFEGRLFIAMAYYGGRSLRTAIDAGPLSPRQSFEVAFSVAQGLWAAHRRGIVHRDIKPGNVVLSDDGFVKIVDFGLAQLAGQSRVTTGDTLLGTIAYMSPEQTNASLVDHRTDIWSLGVVMYESMTGRLPFPEIANNAILYAIRNEPHTPLRDTNPEIPEACAAVVERCLQKKPDDRHASVEALLADMVAAANECGWSDTVGSRTIAPILAARRRRAWVRSAAAAAAVVVVAAGGWLLWERRAPPSPFTTDQRIAVVPFRNLMGPSYNPLVAGLAEHTARVLGEMRVPPGSLWTVPYSAVVQADLPEPFLARQAFGANRIVMGNLQRFEAEQRLTLELYDSSNRKVLRSEAVRIDRGSAASLLHDLNRAIARLVEEGEEAVPPAFETGHGPASIAYLIGSGTAVGKNDSLTLKSAAATLDSCVSDDPTFVAGTWASGLAHMALYRRTKQSSRLQSASMRAHSLASLDGSFAPGAALRGDVLQAQGAPDSAAAAYRQALTFDPGQHGAVRSLTAIYLAQSRVEEAENVYRAFASSRDDYWAAHRDLGYFYYSQGRLDDAETEWKRALALAPRDAWTQSSLGAVYYDRDDWPHARECFIQAFQIQPGCDPCNNVATTLYFDGKYDESAHYFELALQYCDTTQCKFWGNLASALYWTSDGRERSRSVYRVAIQKAESALAASPGDAFLTALLIDYYSMSGDSLMTQSTIGRAGDLVNSDAHVMYSVGSAYEKMGQRQLALLHLANAVRHGYSLQIIRGAPLLADLLRDPIFQDLTQKSDSVDGATTVTGN